MFLKADMKEQARRKCDFHFQSKIALKTIKDQQTVGERAKGLEWNPVGIFHRPHRIGYPNNRIYRTTGETTQAEI
ncbi:MAG: hypothetical protein ACXVBI_00230 [Flavisolibacter sp.]